MWTWNDFEAVVWGLGVGSSLNWVCVTKIHRIFKWRTVIEDGTVYCRAKCQQTNNERKHREIVVSRLAHNT